MRGRGPDPILQDLAGELGPDPETGAAAATEFESAASVVVEVVEAEVAAEFERCLETTKGEVLVAELVPHVGHVQRASCVQPPSRSPSFFLVLHDLDQLVLVFRTSLLSRVSVEPVAKFSFDPASSPFPYVVLDEDDVGARASSR